MKPANEVLVALLVLSLALLLVVLAVRFGVQPLRGGAERLAMATERRRVLVAVQAYRMLQRIPPIAARGAPRRILEGDADAPFARFLDGPTRYPYRWFEDGQGLHALADVPLGAYGVVAVAALAHDLIQGADDPYESTSDPEAWQEQLLLRLREHVRAGNALGIRNATSGRADAVRDPDRGQQSGAPAVLISEAPIHSYRYLMRQPDASLGGSIVVFSRRKPAGAEVFLVEPDGSPAYLMVAGGSGALPRRGRQGW